MLQMRMRLLYVFNSLFVMLNSVYYATNKGLDERTDERLTFIVCSDINNQNTGSAITGFLSN